MANKYDLNSRLPKVVTLEDEVRAEGSVKPISKEVDLRMLRWDGDTDEDDRNYPIMVWVHSEEMCSHEDTPEIAPEDHEDGTLLISHGCNFYKGNSAFTHAFEHYDPTHYDSTGNVMKIREAYRRLQELAIENGWIVSRATNSFIEV